MHAATACSIVLAMHLHAGAHLVERAAYDDRIRWVLPPDRLAAAQHSGFVIDEDRRTTTLADGWVTLEPRDMTTVSGTLRKTTVDVPRHRTDHEDRRFRTTLTPRNDPLPAHPVDVESAAIADMPPQPLCVGQSWRTRVAVTATLGSGIATIDHTIVGVSARGVEIDVHGAGVIYGEEYNLPRLLPGSIRLRGEAWFDPSAGIVVQQSYVLHNRLARTVRGKSIGFLETETVDASARLDGVSGWAPAPARTR